MIFSAVRRRGLHARPERLPHARIPADQTLAYRALRKGIMDYERRQVYRGPEDYVDLPADRKEIDARIAEALQDFPDNDELKAAVVTEASAEEGRRRAAERRGGHDHRRRPEAGDLGARRRRPTRRRRSAPAPSCACIRGAKGDWSITQLPEVEGAFVAMDPRTGAIRAHGRRLRLLEEQVQPRHPGLAPAGLELQALHLLGGAGKGLHAGDRDQRRAAVLRRRHHRQPAVGAEELRRQVRRPDDAARAAGQVEEHGLDPHPAGDRPAVRAAMDHALRLRRRQAPRLPDDGARRRLGHAAADGHRPTASSPTAAIASTRCSSAGSPTRRATCINEARVPTLDESMRTIDAAQRLRHDQPAAGGDPLAAPPPRRRRTLKRPDIYGKTGTTNDSHRRLVRRLAARTSSASSGSATTRRASSATARPAAAWRCRSGSTTCSTR